MILSEVRSSLFQWRVSELCLDSSKHFLNFFLWFAETCLVHKKIQNLFPDAIILRHYIVPEIKEVSVFQIHVSRSLPFIWWYLV